MSGYPTSRNYMFHLFFRLFSKNDSARIRAFWILCVLILLTIIFVALRPAQTPAPTQPPETGHSTTAGGTSFEAVLIFRVAAPSWVSKGRRV
jgi:hypothetical protein